MAVKLTHPRQFYRNEGDRVKAKGLYHLAKFFYDLAEIKQ